MKDKGWPTDFLRNDKKKEKKSSKNQSTGVMTDFVRGLKALSPKKLKEKKKQGLDIE